MGVARCRGIAGHRGLSSGGLLSLGGYRAGRVTSLAIKAVD